MTIVKDFFESLNETAKERVKNPFFGSFILSWLVINWKIVLTIFLSDKSIEEVINGMEISGAFENYQNLVIYPLVFSLLYILVGPYISFGINYVRNKGLLQLKISKYSHEKDVLNAKSILLEKEAENEIKKDQIKRDAEFKSKQNELVLKEKEYSLEEKRNENSYIERKKELDTQLDQLSTKRGVLDKEIKENELLSQNLKASEESMSKRNERIEQYESKENLNVLLIDELKEHNRILRNQLEDTIAFLDARKSTRESKKRLTPSNEQKKSEDTENKLRKKIKDAAKKTNIGERSIA